MLGSGPRSSLTATRAASLLRDAQERTTPDLAVGDSTCPAGPYRVGHVMTCSLRLESSLVVYRVQVTTDVEIGLEPIRPIIDTQKAAELVTSKEPGATATCGLPRIRQVDVGFVFSCTTATSTWDFTVKDQDGQLSGVRR